MEGASITISPTLPIAAVTPYECFVGQYSPFGLFVLEHYLRCRDRIWSEEVAANQQWASHPFPERMEEINYFWNQLHERCASVWQLVSPEERVRFVGLSVSFRIIVEQARSLGKRLIAILRADRLGFDLEEVNSQANHSALIFDPTAAAQPPGQLPPRPQTPPPFPPAQPIDAPSTNASPPPSLPDSGIVAGSGREDTPSSSGGGATVRTKEMSTMTDPVIIRSLSDSSSESTPDKVPEKPRKKRAPRRRKRPKDAASKETPEGGPGNGGDGSGGKPKRIRTAYIHFMSSEGTRIRNELKDDLSEPGALGKYMGQLWKSMSEEEKRPYNEMVRLDKERYDREVLNRATAEATAAAGQGSEAQPAAAAVVPRFPPAAATAAPSATVTSGSFESMRAEELVHPPQPRIITGSPPAPPPFFYSQITTD